MVQSLKVVLLRVLIVLALLPSVLICMYRVWDDAARSENVRFIAQTNEEMYARVKTGLAEFEVDRIFEEKGKDVGGPGWPKVLGEVPEFKGVNRPSLPVRWKKWKALGPDRWVFVGLLSAEGRESFVITKRKFGF